jgi:hypothetical protein
MIIEKSLSDISREFNRNKNKKKKENKLKLFVMSNYSTQFIEESMKLSALEKGLNLEVQTSGYNQWEFSILNFDNIENEYKELCEQGKVKVSIIPDICSVEFGRGVGYDIIEHTPPQEIHDISATKVREQMRKEGKL